LRKIYWILIAAPALIFPFTMEISFYVHIAIMCFYYAVLASSWNLVSGYAGQFSFAQAAFAGVGAYTSALLVLYTGIPIVAGILVAGAFVAAIGYGLGYVCLRMRGPYLALTTLGFSETVRQIFLIEYPITRGSMGLTVEPLFQTTSRVPYYFVMLGIFVVSLYAIHRIINSRMGLFLKALREDEDAASIMGVDTRRVKTTIFATSGFFAGIAGGFYAHYIQMLNPNIMLLTEMGIIVAMTVIGGLGSFIGPIAGAFLVEIFGEYVRFTYAEYHLVVLGAAVVFIIRFGREGLVKLFENQMKRVITHLQHSRTSLKTAV